MLFIYSTHERLSVGEYEVTHPSSSAEVTMLTYTFGGRGEVVMCGYMLEFVNVVCLLRCLFFSFLFPFLILFPSFFSLLSASLLSLPPPYSPFCPSSNSFL